MNEANDKLPTERGFTASDGYALSPLETRVLALVDHMRVEDTPGIANRLAPEYRRSSVNGALLRLHKRGLIAIEEKGKAGQKGYPTVWATKTNW